MKPTFTLSINLCALLFKLNDPVSFEFTCYLQDTHLRMKMLLETTSKVLLTLL